MQIENSPLDIFTEFDDSIFSEGAIDPMGLRIIWTALGNAIFENRLNTISVDIRYYTINLLHHFVIWQCCKEHKQKVLELTGRAPYNSENDLFDGMIIFLEMILTNVVAKMGNTEVTVPALSKLKSIQIQNRNDEKAVSAIVDKNSGILVRHIGLGIHGRHKGPFQQMDIFQSNNYYANEAIWNEVEKLFSKSKRWSNLAEGLKRLIVDKVLSEKNGQKHIRHSIESIVDEELKELYHETLQPKSFKSKSFIDFWEDKLGLQNPEAQLIYNQIKALNKDSDYQYQQLIEQASINDNSGKIKAICAIEPLLARIEKSMDRLLQRGTTEIDGSLINDIKEQLAAETINFKEIEKYATYKYVSESALERLKKLIDIVRKVNSDKDISLYVENLINYHKELFESRNNLPWLTIGNGKITQHRSFIYSDNYKESLTDNSWRNYYYLGTVHSLYNGLYQ
ncbi:hypothetical protein [Plebeiibacterium sediminum]|uniref:Uncharacterized protein n=1 Tax=Plebeiibacterium sediminum TaxID=2992112 RepID=A0AAE3SH84_9BACT|nr:hypothetical protein [Plebeiobacterium sediminum]MCW3789283.1 hypothetical protein [Plebeiobacterium sediminum]